MTRDLKGIVLTYPVSHTAADTLRILEAYRADHPEMYERWIEIETHPVEDERDALKEVQIDGLNYLHEACKSDDTLAVGMTWALMRRELLNILRAQGAFGENQ